MKINDVIAEVTERIGGRSAAARGEYLERTRKRKLIEPARGKLSCSNLAHVLAASGEDKPRLQQSIPNIGVVTAYNDLMKFMKEQNASAAKGDQSSIARESILRGLKGAMRGALSDEYATGGSFSFLDI